MSDETPPGTTTYRGRSLEEVLPQVRSELGPDAIIERQRTGLVGGMGGFFQREMVEVDARPALGAGPRFDALAGDDDEDAVRAAVFGEAPAPADAALEWAPEPDAGLQAPGMRRIVAQASPFADLLAGAAQQPPQDDEGEEDGEDPARAPEPEPAPEPAPAPRAVERRPPSPLGEDPRRSAEGTEPEPELEPFALPPAAQGHERRFVEHGLSPQLAASVVAETLAHAVPFAAPRQLKRTVRTTLARRVPVQAGLGGAGRVIALVGAAGAGKTRTAAGLAAAYAATSDRPLVCLTLHADDAGAGLRALLEPRGVPVHAGDDGPALRERLAGAGPPAGVVGIVDTPPVSPRDDHAIAALAADLDAAGVTEAHLVLPATVAGPVARAALDAFAPVRPAALVITHADETDHLGPIVDLAIEAAIPLSFVVTGADVGEGVTLADPAALATRLLP